VNAAKLAADHNEGFGWFKITIVRTIATCHNTGFKLSAIIREISSGSPQHLRVTAMPMISQFIPSRRGKPVGEMFAVFAKGELVHFASRMM
jgi:hypothetical protein